MVVDEFTIDFGEKRYRIRRALPISQLAQNVTHQKLEKFEVGGGIACGDTVLSKPP